MTTNSLKLMSAIKQQSKKLREHDEWPKDYTQHNILKLQNIKDNEKILESRQKKKPLYLKQSKELHPIYSQKPCKQEGHAMKYLKC